MCVDEYRIELEKYLATALCCPECNRNSLALRESTSKFLECSHCEIQFLVTDDYIPIFLPDVQDDVLKANIAVYDNISTEYQRKKTKRIPERLSGIFGRWNQEVCMENKRHLDIGCGPGPLLFWLKQYKTLGVGVDVSVENLRNARDLTGAFVACANASSLPFRDDCFDFITESAVLHHVVDWESAIKEMARVGHADSRILIDSEPSIEQWNISWAAATAYKLRKPFYRFVDLVRSKRAIFNSNDDLDDVAEVHNQPGRGLSPDFLTNFFASKGYRSDCVHSPNAQFRPERKNLPIQIILLNLLSFRNPWNARFGGFSILIQPKEPKAEN